MSAENMNQDPMKLTWNRIRPEPSLGKEQTPSRTQIIDCQVASCWMCCCCQQAQAASDQAGYQPTWAGAWKLDLLDQNAPSFFSASPSLFYFLAEIECPSSSPFEILWFHPYCLWWLLFCFLCSIFFRLWRLKSKLHVVNTKKLS